MRYRSEIIQLPWNDPEHKAYRETLWVGGPHCGCVYYFSMLTKKDCFNLDIPELQQVIRNYIAQHFGKENAKYIYMTYWAEFILPYLKKECYQLYELDASLKFSKEERAFLLLLENPTWDDEKIRVELKTTEKAMKRWSQYNAIRIMMRRNAKNIS